MKAKNINWLTTLDMQQFIARYADQNTKKAFLGIFPIDHLPQTIPHLPILFIVNTNTCNLPGQHWKVIFVSKQGIGEVFDPLATPITLALQCWLNEHTKRWTLSKLTLQNPLSPTCGGYALYYIMCRLKTKSLNSCLAPFSNNVFANDILVENFLQQFL